MQNISEFVKKKLQSFLEEWPSENVNNSCVVSLTKWATFVEAKLTAVAKEKHAQVCCDSCIFRKDSYAIMGIMDLLILQAAYCPL